MRRNCRWRDASLPEHRLVGLAGGLDLRITAAADDAAVDDDVLAVDERRLLARQEKRHVGDVLGESGTRDRLKPDQRRLDLLSRGFGSGSFHSGNLAEDAGCDAAGRYGVHAYI